MSEVISFRLNKDNLREAKALLVLQEWKKKGYNIRQTITEALLKLDQNIEGSEISSLEGLTEALIQVNHLLRQIEVGKSISINNYCDDYENNCLPASFIASVKMSAKSGVKID